MSVRGVFWGSVAGIGAYMIFRAVQAGEPQQGEFEIIQVAQPTRQKENPGRNLLLGLAGGIVDAVSERGLGDLLDFDRPATPTVPTRPQSAPAATPTPSGAYSTGQGNFGPLLSLIKRHESGGNYDIVWSGISRADQPPRKLTTMTVNEVLAWQDSIDRKYMSEAAGAYQFLEDTLRLLKSLGYVSGNARFDRATQDALAIARMRQQRGLDRYQAGQITDVQFAQNLAKEWASLPAQTRDKRGRPATGQSYYAGDGLNRSFTSKETVLQAVRMI